MYAITLLVIASTQTCTTVEKSVSASSTLAPRRSGVPGPGIYSRPDFVRQAIFQRAWICPPEQLTRQTKNIVFLSTPLDDDMFEIPLPSCKRRAIAASQKHKGVIMFPEIMDVLLVDKKDKAVDMLGKGKKPIPLFQQGSSSGIGTKSLEKSHGLKRSDFFIDADDYGTDSSFFGENEMLFDDSALMDLSCDDYLDDQYAILQSHLDGLDAPPGVEWE
ncbi:hypothetical protein OROHE_019515 [Orobanche hederae]